jgi:hypothetical protein
MYGASKPTGLCSKQTYADLYRHQHSGLREGYQRQDRL